jgi:phenylpropionate dioxygenase-like ring-hydroxylating dioxygenase large terminal subunit
LSADIIHVATDLSPTTYPSSWYSDAAVYEAELSRIFRATWQYAGPLDHVRDPGDYMTTTVGGVPIVVVRGKAGELRAFVNICRHRYSPVVSGRGNRQVLQCPYHAWTYRLDGTLAGAPRSSREADFDCEALSLRPVLVDTWGPLVFVNLDRHAPPARTVWGDIPERYEATGLAIAQLEFRERRVYDVAANWKVATENILECYHCPIVHPGYSRLMDLDDYELETSGLTSIQSTRLRSTGGEAQAGTYDVSGSVTIGLYAFVFPNFMFNVNPGQGHFHTNHVEPNGVGRAKWVNDFFFVPDVSDTEASAYVRFQDEVSREDLPTTAGAGMGAAAAGAAGLETGRLMLASELTIAHFQALVREALT